MSIKKRFILFGLLLLTVPSVIIGLIFYNFTSNIGHVSLSKFLWENLPEHLIENYIYIIIVIVAVIIILAAVAGYYLIKSFVTPLNALTKIAEQIGEGNLEVEIKWHKKDEFGEVFSQFDEMRTRLKDSIMQKAEMENARKEMIANISHDLKTPLTSISGYASGILDGIADTHEKKQKYLNTIITRTEDINRLVDDLFLFSKLDSKQVTFNLQVTDILAYIREATEEISLEYKERGNLNITLHPCDVPNIYVKIDTMQCKRVILNIVSNSIKYKQGNETRIDVEIYKNDFRVILKFSDNGIGIPEKDIVHVFDRFYRSDAARSNPGNPYGGSGLGLSIAKQIIEAQGGRIWARSRENTEKTGTSIYISFPETSELN